ncbi:hypothetical protein CC2G_013525 [Coprinopsis cinerea AmutBmut pab1-1]|nr:hypothetical protein CC2G_013525 [Coprinopsis cinerea AmutBmut pab1-1]
MSRETPVTNLATCCFTLRPIGNVPRFHVAEKIFCRVSLKAMTRLDLLCVTLSRLLWNEMAISVRLRDDISDRRRAASDIGAQNTQAVWVWQLVDELRIQRLLDVVSLSMDLHEPWDVARPLVRLQSFTSQSPS